MYKKLISTTIIFAKLASEEFSSEDMLAAYELIISSSTKEAVELYLGLPIDIQNQFLSPQYMNKTHIAFDVFGFSATVNKIIKFLIAIDPNLYNLYDKKLRKSIAHIFALKYKLSSLLNDMPANIKLITLILNDSVIDDQIKNDIRLKVKNDEILRRKIF